MISTKTEAIIIRNIELTNNDRIVTVFTPFNGRLSLVAKGASRSLKRFGGSIDIISRVDLEYSYRSGSDLGRLINVVLKDSYPVLREDYGSIMLSAYFLDLMRHFHTDRFSVPNSYMLLSMVLSFMNAGVPQGSLLQAFQIKLLCAVGLKINSRYCCRCGKDILKEVKLSSGDGPGPSDCSYGFNELYCPGCEGRDRKVSSGALAFVEKVSMSPIRDFLGLAVPSEYEKDLFRFIDDHIDGHLNKHLKSRDLIGSL